MWWEHVGNVGKGVLISASAVSQWGSGEQRPEKNPNQSPAFINCCPTGRSGVFPCRISNCRKSTKRLDTTDPYACSPRNKSSSKNVLTVRCLCYLTLCLSVYLFVSVCLSLWREFCCFRPPRIFLFCLLLLFFSSSEVPDIVSTRNRSAVRVQLDNVTLFSSSSRHHRHR